MRRINTVLKEHILWTRARVVGIDEQMELLWEQYDKEGYGEIAETFEGIKEDIRDMLTSMVGVELSDLVEEFNLDPSAPNSAMPEIDMVDESITDYASDLIEDVMSLPTLSALEIVDELESWINDLYMYHVARNN
jgi:hypothetical protein